MGQSLLLSVFGGSRTDCAHSRSFLLVATGFLIFAVHQASARVIFLSVLVLKSRSTKTFNMFRICPEFVKRPPAAPNDLGSDIVTWTLIKGDLWVFEKCI